jgi:hypothetical protein
MLNRALFLIIFDTTKKELKNPVKKAQRDLSGNVNALGLMPLNSASCFLEF